MEKKQKIIFGVLAAVIAFGIAGIAAMLVQSSGRATAALEARDSAKSQLDSIYRSPMFPSPENRKIVEGDKIEIETWLAAVSNRLHQGDIHVNEAMTPSMWIKTVEDMRRQFGTRQTADGFAYGFEQYLGAGKLPAQADVARLAKQAEIIKAIMTELTQAGVLKITRMSRPVFEEADASAQTEQVSTRRGRAARGAQEQAAVKKESAEAVLAGGLALRQRYTVEFTAAPTALIETMNRLMAMPLFAVVSDFEIKGPSLKKGPQTAPANSKTDPAAENAAYKDLSHEARVISDPLLSDPLQIRLDIDVYTFQGV